MTAVSNLVDSMICAGCDGEMVITPDAIGRPRKRCPKCQGVAEVRHHPDDVLTPITVVSLAKLTAAALPPVEPGQLRCQRCAKGVEGDARFHPECQRAQRAEAKERASQKISEARRRTVYKMKPCKWPGCQVVFKPSGPAAKYCGGHG